MYTVKLTEGLTKFPPKEPADPSASVSRREGRPLLRKPGLRMQYARSRLVCNIIRAHTGSRSNSRNIEYPSRGNTISQRRGNGPGVGSRRCESLLYDVDIVAYAFAAFRRNRFRRSSCAADTHVRYTHVRSESACAVRD